MHEQITIIDQPTLGPAVSGRQVHGLIAKSNASRDIFSDWFADRIKKLSLQDGVDYLRSSVRLPGHNRQHIEYIVSVSAAIRIAQYQSGKRGVPLANYLTAHLQNPAAAQPAEPTPSDSTPFPELKSTVAVVSSESAPAAVVEQPATPVEPPTIAKQKTPGELLLEQAMQMVADEQKRAQEPLNEPNYAELFGERLSAAESKINALLGIFQQAGALAIPAPPETKETDLNAPPTIRTVLCRLVNNYAAATQKTEHDTWRYLYGHYALRTGVDVYAQVPGKRGDQSYLAAIEAANQIGDLYELAKKLFVLPAMK